MYCTNCGSPNEPTARFCNQCRTPLMGTGMVGQGDPLGPTQPRLAQSILVTLFCCQLTGIVAIVYSAMAMSANGERNYAKAHEYARNANMWGWISVGIGLAGMLIYAVIIAAVGVGP